jgi:NDP-sugar pyrophosphorylase family protein
MNNAPSATLEARIENRRTGPDHPPKIENSQSVLRLVAPDFAALDTIWRNPLPFVLWPIGPQPLIAHWMDDAVRQGFDEVEVYVADRPAAVRLALEGGVYWSRPVRVIPIASEADAPADALRVDHFPDAPAAPFSGDARQLLEHWFDLQKAWLASRGKERVVIDERHPSGGWIGPHANVHPSAKLTAPFWIGPNARIGEDCQLGPHALIGENSILGSNVEVENACLLPNTCLGHNTRSAGRASSSAPRRSPPTDSWPRSPSSSIAPAGPRAR